MDERPFEFVVRPAGSGDAAILADFRLASERERHPERSEEAFARYRDDCGDFFGTELVAVEPYLRMWVALAGRTALGAAGLTLVRSMPRLGQALALDGRIRDVFVRPDARRRGIARTLVRAAIAEAERVGVGRLTLGTSADGQALYESLGFVLKPDEMVYRNP